MRSGIQSFVTITLLVQVNLLILGVRISFSKDSHAAPSQEAQAALADASQPVLLGDPNMTPEQRLEVNLKANGYDPTTVAPPLLEELLDVYRQQSSIKIDQRTGPSAEQLESLRLLSDQEQALIEEVRTTQGDPDLKLAEAERSHFSDLSAGRSADGFIQSTGASPAKVSPTLRRKIVEHFRNIDDQPMPRNRDEAERAMVVENQKLRKFEQELQRSAGTSGKAPGAAPVLPGGKGHAIVTLERKAPDGSTYAELVTIDELKHREGRLVSLWQQKASQFDQAIAGTLKRCSGATPCTEQELRSFIDQSRASFKSWLDKCARVGKETLGGYGPILQKQLAADQTKFEQRLKEVEALLHPVLASLSSPKSAHPLLFDPRAWTHGSIKSSIPQIPAEDASSRHPDSGAAAIAI